MADSNENEPSARNERHQKTDKLGTKFVNKTGEWEDKARHKGSSGDAEKKGPAGGFDDTPIPSMPPGHTLKFTFHRAKNLPFADISTLSADPYFVAVLQTDLPKRHKQDPDLKLRCPTIHRNTDPEWNVEWVVANVPASGFFMKIRLYDEDPADHDDRLGNVHINVPSIGDSWTGFKEKEFDIKKRMGSKRAYLIRGAAALFNSKTKMGGEMIISIENLGQTQGDYRGRMFTVGPLPWSRHYSPLIGRLTGTKDSEESGDGKKTAKYNFQALQIQFSGPVPEPLYHRYVEFKPFVAGMFTDHSLRGRILNRALHHQHARIYNYDKSTVYGIFPRNSPETTRKFLEFVHYDQGGRIFTYVITLDALWRFTETGKEFGIDMLSKHTMHSDVSEYIAFSGEFFIRRLKPPRSERGSSPDPGTEALPPSAEKEETKEGQLASAGSKNPEDYELIIDNDSGTYRPNAMYLHMLKEFMASNLPGLKVVTLDCQGDEEKMKKLKDEQREKKKTTGTQITYLQNKSTSSISSSEESELDRRASNKDETTTEKYKHKIENMGELVFARDHHGHNTDDEHHPRENEKEVVVDGHQRPGPGALQESGGYDHDQQEETAHQQTTTTTTTTTSTSTHVA